ncbi:MAG: YcaQ family DNA glycosylase [Anaerolineae bacterium]|nr:YcaQ family DNA glycosylase [Anaerolineae bacterium]
MKLSIPAARRLALLCQGLDGQWPLPPGKEGAAQVIERLSYVQIDTISVVQRAHHHVFWTRQPDYTPQLLDDLLTHDRRVFEGWTHAASYIPLRDYRYHLPRMRARRSHAQEWLREHKQLVKEVLDRIRAEGPLGTADFKAPEEFERGTWWSWKPAKEALETLLAVGDLMVAERRNFQRIYDLTERVLPDWVDTEEPIPEEVARFEIRRVLAMLGAASKSEIQWRRGNKKALSEAIDELVDSGEMVAVEIDGQQGPPWYALAERIEQVTDAAAGDQDSASLHILSPFDNLVILRRWTEALYDFRYRIECYTPEAKRQYGYFALPVLWGEQFVARVDTKADRKTQTLIVRQLTFEPQVTGYERLLPVLAGKLWAFAAFNDCQRIVVERVEPTEMTTELVQKLAQNQVSVP